MKVMIERTLKRSEVLAPAGMLEKLKVAIRHGADAAYTGGNAYGPHNRAGDSTSEEMAEGVIFAREHSAKVYVAANMVTHEGSQEGAGAFFRELRDIGISVVIVSDPALIEICATEALGLPIHSPTQASATNYETLEFWKNEGLERVVSVREVSMEEVAAIRENMDIETEAFIHEAIRVSYSGRCALSNHMSMRGANRGDCSQSCRWKYELFDMPFGTERRSKISEGEVEGRFLMSAVDMSMIEHTSGLIENGVDSLKAEGRMKSIHHVSTVANVYKRTIDPYMEDPKNYVCQQEWIDELWKVAQRELAIGFHYSTPSENERLFGERRRIPQHKFVGEVIAYNEKTQVATIRQRNLFSVDDEIEFYGLGLIHFHQIIKEMYNEDGEAIDWTPNPTTSSTMEAAQPVAVGDMIRKKK